MSFRLFWTVGLFSLLACRQAPAASPVVSGARASLTYLGVAGWQLTIDDTSLLVDPYFTRAAVTDPEAPLAPDEAAITRYAPARAAAILVTHAHYDHLLDAPTIALRTGAAIVGSQSALNVALASGVPSSRLDLAIPDRPITLGPFVIRPLRAEHSLTGQAFGTIAPSPSLPMPASAYKVGETFQYLVQSAGPSVLFIGTANFIDGSLDGLRPDVAVIAVGLREKIPDYSCRLMRLLGKPPLVLANHFDAHRTPLGRGGMVLGDEDRAELARFVDEIHACAPKTRVVVPRHFEPVPL